MDNQNTNNDNFNYNAEQELNQNVQEEPVQSNRYAQPDFTFYNGNSYQRNGETLHHNQNDNYNYYNYQNNSYQNTGYQGENLYQGYTPYEEPKKQKKKREKKEWKSNGFGMKLVKCTALALVFGLVAGSVMVGIQYAARPFLNGSEQNADSNMGAQVGLPEFPDKDIESTAISNTYVAVDVSDIVDEVMPSIVAITNISETEYRGFWGSQTYESTSAGSGIIISSDGEYLYIATNNHVIDGAKTLTVTFANNATVSAEVKGTDPSIDLAVVKVELNSIESSTMEVIKMATLGDSELLRVGEASIAIGNALGYGQSVTMGVISALDRVVTVADSSSSTGYTAELIQTDAAINPGNSGGALLNARGEVIGINSVKYADTDVEGIGYAIPMSTAAPIIHELITKEKVDESNSSYLGISGVDVTSSVASTYNMPTGVYVAQVFENTAAEKYGIIPGDIIVKFDGKDVTSMDSLTTTLQYYAAGSTVEITVMRAHNGQYQEQIIEVVLGKKN
ncbi:MAG: trypsin-like peptidase domain-containing protein [Roseburia sp.]|nr:trypsin-like peptidase domain-containing protein [Roseburia sp.]